MKITEVFVYTHSKHLSFYPKFNTPVYLNRLGKVVWTQLSEDILGSDEGLTVEVLNDVLHGGCHRRSFNTE